MRRALTIVVPVLLALAVGLPASPAAAAPACGPPGDILDLSNWKLTLPTGSKGHPTEVTQPALHGFSVDPWFTADAMCDGVRFRAAVNGVTTSGSRNPRSELREMTGGGSAQASWSTTSGTSTMVIDEAVTHLPEGRPQIVVGQIHGADDDLTVFRLEGSKLWVTDGDDPHHQLVTDGYRLGTRFTVTFVAHDGRIDAYYGDRLVTTIASRSAGNYFKAGAYTQANCGTASPCAPGNYGEVVLYGLTVSHTN